MKVSPTDRHDQPNEHTNGKWDEYERHVRYGNRQSILLDCDRNAAVDTCELDDGTAFDYNGNGILDVCDCTADIGGGGGQQSDGTVNVIDLLEILYNGGYPPRAGERTEPFAISLSDWASAYHRRHRRLDGSITP